MAFVTACQAVTGLPGTGLAALVLVFAGNAVSGGTVPFAFLPGGFRQVAPWLPNGAIVSAARDVVYLPGSDLGHPLLVLGIWLAASLAVLAAVDLLHLAERRRTPQREADIYATPGTAHLRRRLARQPAAALETASTPRLPLIQVPPTALAGLGNLRGRYRDQLTDQLSPGNALCLRYPVQCCGLAFSEVDVGPLHHHIIHHHRWCR